MKTVLARLALASVLVAALVSLVACSSSDTTSTSSSFSCCVNHLYYNCRTTAEEQTCGTQNMTCPRDSSGDQQCVDK